MRSRWPSHGVHESREECPSSAQLHRGPVALASRDLAARPRNLLRLTVLTPSCLGVYWIAEPRVALGEADVIKLFRRLQGGRQD